MRIKNHLITLHGFMGLPSDWDAVGSFTPADWVLHNENLWDQISDFRTWSENFCARIEKLEGNKILLGYSMGGRLAMHALAHKPQLFSGAVIVSANPGLKTESARGERVTSDYVWAQKFRKLPWSDLMNEWNSQGVFSSAGDEAADLASVKLERSESDFDRELLAEAMELWSLGYQKDLETRLRELELPILFLTGAKDTKFTTLTRELIEKSARGDRPLVVVPKAGHRVPWDAPSEFRTVVANFLSRWYR